MKTNRIATFPKFDWHCHLSVTLEAVSFFLDHGTEQQTTFRACAQTGKQLTQYHATKEVLATQPHAHTKILHCSGINGITNLR